MQQAFFLSVHRTSSAAPGASPRADRPRGRLRGLREAGPGRMWRLESEREQRKRRIEHWRSTSASGLSRCHGFPRPAWRPTRRASSWRITT